MNDQEENDEESSSLLPGGAVASACAEQRQPPTPAAPTVRRGSRPRSTEQRRRTNERQRVHRRCDRGQPTAAGPRSSHFAAGSDSGQRARTLTVLTHESFALSDAVLQQFEQANNVKVKFIKQGDAGQALTRAILTKDNPEADVLFGVDNTFMGRALDADILDLYQPSALSCNMPQEFQLDPTQSADSDRLWRCVHELRQGVLRAEEAAPPQSLADLTKPEYKNLLVIENPAASSPGLAFMLATVSAFGEDHWLDYWND